MLLHGINDNTTIPHLSYSGVYQYEARKKELHKEIIVFWGWNQSQKTDKNAMHVSLSKLEIKEIQPTTFFNVCWV